jgi:hypothetical protein
MSDQLSQLSKQRQALFRELSTITEHRPGTISVNFRRCGKPYCHCAKPGATGHGPQYLWNTTRKGKSIAKNIPAGPLLAKYTKEVENHRKFLQLIQQIIELDEQIADLLPLPSVDDNALATIKKKLQQRSKKKPTAKSRA